MTIRPLRVSISVALVAAGVTGCLGGSPRLEYFTLRSAAGAAAGPALAALPELGIAVGPLEIPRYLDRPEIVTQDGSNRLVVADAHRWGGSLRSDILRVVADDLGRLLGTPRVAVYPVEARFPARYRILLDVREIESVQGVSVTLLARWTVASMADGSALAIEEARIEQPVASASFDDLVAAQSAAFGTLSRRIAERVTALAAE